MIGKTISHLPREIIRQSNFVGIDRPNISRGEQFRERFVILLRDLKV
jgi:hypothetical protein